MPNSGMIIPTLGATRSRRSTRKSLADAVFTKTQQRVLRVLFGQPERSFYASELIREAGTGSGAAQRELARLERGGIIVARRIGNAAPSVEGMAVFGPAPAPLAMLRGRHRQRLLVHAARKLDVQDVLRDWLASRRPSSLWKNSSVTRGRSSAEMPMPLSHTSRRTRSPRRRAASSTPPRSV